VGVVSIVTVIWFLIGGTYDILDLIRRLRNVELDVSDDGVVRDDFHDAEQAPR
jgi:hypothetical protein